MGDPTPATDRIVALIKLTGNLVSLVYEHLWRVDEAPKDLQTLVDELQSLGKVLTRLRNYPPADNTKEFLSSVFQRLNASNGPLFECTIELKRLQLKLGSGNLRNPAEGTRGLSCLLGTDGILPHILRIEKHKNVFTLALQLISDQSKLSEAMAGYRCIQGMDDGKENPPSDLAIRNARTRALQVAVKRKKDLDWLYSGDFESRYLDLQERRLKGTGEWVLQSPIFQNWIKGKSGCLLLWGRSIAGAGKTYTSSKIIDHIQAEAQIQNYAVAYVFFDYMERDQQQPKHVLSSLIKQLACQTQSFSGLSRKLLLRLADEQLEPTLEKLSTNLIETSKSFDRVFLVLDGLDECDQTKQRNDLLPVFHALAKGNISVLLTSQLQPGDIQRSLHMVPKIDLSAKDEDIKIYIEQTIDSSPRAKRLLEQGKCWGKFVAELTACADGMFLLVHLLMRPLCRLPTIKQLFKKLDNLRLLKREDRLLSAYAQVINSISYQGQACTVMASKILTWLVKARRTLTVDELHVAVSVEPNRYELEESDLSDKETILDVCAGLVVINQNSNTVHLIHYTVRDYLLGSHILLSNADCKVAIACITYLSFSAFSEGSRYYWSEEPGSSSIMKDRLNAYPFFKYAAKYMSAHINSCGHSLTTKAFLKFAKSPGQVNFYIQELEDDRFINKEDTSPLLVSALVGHLPAVRLLVEGEGNILSQGSGRLVLHAAVKGNHLEVVRLLLENERAKRHAAHQWEPTDLSTLDNDGKAALHLAARGGYTDIVKLLLENGAGIEERGQGHQAPLHEAARGGHEEVVNLLLDEGASAWSMEECCQTALHVAAEEGHEGIVKRLLKHCDDATAEEREYQIYVEERGHNFVRGLYVKACAGVSARDRRVQTPLHLAARGSHTGIVRLLLENGADVSVKDSSGGTALHMAVYGGEKSIVQLLLQNGVDVSVKARTEVTALHRAAVRGYTEIIQMLLDSGADISAKQYQVDTALLFSLDGGYGEAVQLLLDNGAKISTPTEASVMLSQAAKEGYCDIVQILLNNGANISNRALHDAAAMGHKDVVKLLLEGGADISLRDEAGQSVLHVAAQNDHEDIVKLLLEGGADISLRSRAGQSVLHVAAQNGHEGIVKLLLENGADIWAREELEQTPLHKAASSTCKFCPLGSSRMRCVGNEEVIRLLLEFGADISAQDKRRQTALILAARGGCKEVVKILIAHGSDVSTHDTDGNTALHNAARNGHAEVAQLLLDHGANISVRNQNHQTTMLLAARWGHEKVVQLLLKSGAEIIGRDENGRTPFYLAARHGHHDVVRLLVENGADITERDEEHRTAFIHAAEEGHYKVVEIILRNGGDISEKNKEGQTAFFLAAWNNYYELLQLLIKEGADISEKNKDGQTAFFVAAGRGHLNIVRLLLENGVDISETNADGQTALFMAAGRWHRDVFHLLIEKGADRFVRDRHGDMAILEEEDDYWGGGDPGDTGFHGW